MANSAWVPVSSQNPCPRCGKPDWCAVLASGTKAKCMREPAGAYRTKTDKNGTPYYLHRLKGDRLAEARSSRTGGKVEERAKPDLLYKVYEALLRELSLNKSHRLNLKDRGLTAEAIENRRYRSMPLEGRSRIARKLRGKFSREQLLSVPGFIEKPGKDGSYLTLAGPPGLVVPVRDRTDRIVAIKIRRDEVGKGEQKYLYLSSKYRQGPGPGSPVHIPRGTPETAETVRVVEGELKADIVQSLTGEPTISIPGASVWRPSLEVLRAMACKTVRLAFDADARTNPKVAAALAECAAALADAGFEVEVEMWNVADGKGLDDLLANGNQPELIQGPAARSAIRALLFGHCGEVWGLSSDDTNTWVVPVGADPNAVGELAGTLKVAEMPEGWAGLTVPDPPPAEALRPTVRGRNLLLVRVGDHEKDREASARVAAATVAAGAAEVREVALDAGSEGGDQDAA